MILNRFHGGYRVKNKLTIKKDFRHFQMCQHFKKTSRQTIAQA